MGISENVRLQVSNEYMHIENQRLKKYKLF